jgi:hypothetical protein
VSLRDTVIVTKVGDTISKAGYNFVLPFRTPLHWAAHRGHVDVVSALLLNGGDPNAKNLSGQLPSDLARGSEIKRLLGGKSFNYIRDFHKNSILTYYLVTAPEEEQEKPTAPLHEEIRESVGFVPRFMAEPDLDKLWRYEEGMS